ncbi:hypothetical protein [Streptomyces sp. NPDC048224]|uniref:hypothetical protein n=1 Tax=Streptomyces sp. NPDC048224 TaxID=3154500 RepID=UPI00340ECA43
MHEARASTASVAAALHDVASLGGFFALRVGGPDDGRHPLAHSYQAGFTDLAEAVARRHRTSQPRVDVSIAQLGHADRPGGGPVRALHEQVTGHLSALADGLRVKIAPRLLDGNSASALAGAARALLALRPAVRAPLTDLTTAPVATGRLFTLFSHG